MQVWDATTDNDAYICNLQLSKYILDLRQASPSVTEGQRYHVPQAEWARFGETGHG